MITLNSIPCATLDDAIATARNLPVGEDKSICITDETVYLSRPICLDQRDSGLHLVGNATLTGGMRLTNLIPDGDGFFSATVPVGADPAALIVNGRFCERSCYPAQGTLTYSTTCDLEWMSSTKGGWDKKPTHEQLTSLCVDPQDIPADIVVENAYITVYHEWDESTVRIKAFDRTTGQMTLASEMEHPAGAFEKSAYVLRGIREGMTTPGQWYFDRMRRKVVYFPFADENVDTLEMVIPVVDHIFCLKNANNVNISGFALTACNNTHERSGLRAIQCYGAIQAEDCENLILSDLNISSTAGHGIRLFRCPNSKISRCRVENCGAGGIFEHECAPALVQENTIRSIGKTTASAIGIHAGGKSQLVYVLDGFRDAVGSVTIAGNTVTDTPYCAITCNGGPHCIENNRIESSMTVLRDGAAIYSSRAKNTRICGNYITRIGTGKGKAHGIYFDEKSYGCYIEGNLIEDVYSPMMFHISHQIEVRNNVIVNSKGGIRFSPAVSHHLYFKENIISAAGAIQFLARNNKTDTPWEFDEIFCCTTNLIFSQTGEYGYHYELSWATIDDFEPLPSNNGILRIDPKLTLHHGTIQLTEDSPLHWLNFPLSRMKKWENNDQA